MNLELMQKHIDGALASIDSGIEYMEKDGSNANRFYCADVVANRKFAQNYGGYPRSEIAEINAQANLEIQKSMLAQLADFTNQPNPTAGMSDAQLMLSHRSKYQQAPSEMQSWLEGQLQIRDAQRAQMIAEAQAAAAAKSPKGKKTVQEVPADPE